MKHQALAAAVFALLPLCSQAADVTLEVEDRKSVV